MSPNHYSILSVSQHDKPEQIKVKIRILTQLYIHASDPLIAKSVENHVAAILAYPKYIERVE